MVKIIKPSDLRALDNFSIVVAAKKNGLKIYPADMWINYAEIDDHMTKVEDDAVEKAARLFLKVGREWLSKIKTKEDIIKPPADLEETLGLILSDTAKTALEKGSESAAAEIEVSGIQRHAESGGKPSKLPDWRQKNDDAYEWYQLYMRKLSKKTSIEAFEYMQEKILEHIEKGETGKKLSEALAADFARYGSVRTDIIARTEVNKAYNWGRRYRFDSSSVIAGYRYSAILDSRTTPICRGLHGHSWKIDDPDLDAYTPPNHYRCRSVIVPISSFVDFQFNPPDKSWADSLPDKQKKILSKFMDSSWYPKAATVAEKILPKELPAPAAPTKGSDNNNQVTSEIPVNLTTKLTDDDIGAADTFKGMIKGSGIGAEATDTNVRKTMKKLAGSVMDKDQVSKMKFSIKKNDTSAGSITYFYRKLDGKDTIDVSEFYIKKDYFSNDANKWETVLHEFYHMNYHGLVTDRRGFDIASKWVQIEETFTETSAQYMSKLAGVDLSGTIPAYAEHLTSVLPRLKKAVPDFADCETLDDFGAKMLKYRFSDNHKTAEWKSIYDQIKDVDHNVAVYADPYMDYINNHKNDIVSAAYESYYHGNLKNGYDKEKALKVFGNLFDNQVKSKSGSMFYDALLYAMKEMGIK